MTPQDRQDLRDKLRIILDHSDNYAIYRFEQIVEHTIREAEERGYVAGWNAACDDPLEPERKKAIKKSYGFKNV